MRYYVIILLGFIAQAAWGDVQLKLIDQNAKPVANAVVSLLGHKVATPNTIAKMDQIHMQFSPHVLVIQKEQQVSFPNKDDFRHQVYSFSPAKKFELKLYKGTESKPVLFDQSGLVVLGCNIHDEMIGYIFVADNTFAAKTNEQGIVNLPAKQGGKITVWSEREEKRADSSEVYVLKDQATQTIQLELLPPAQFEMDMSHHEAAKFGKTF